MLSDKIENRIKDDWEYLVCEFKDIWGEEYIDSLLDVPINVESKYGQKTGCLARTTYGYSKKYGGNVIIVSFAKEVMELLEKTNEMEYLSVILHEMIHCRLCFEDKNAQEEHGRRFWKFAKEIEENTVDGINIKKYADESVIEDCLYDTKKGKRTYR
jgi:hypothetical protein